MLKLIGIFFMIFQKVVGLIHRSFENQFRCNFRKLLDQKEKKVRNQMNFILKFTEVIKNVH